MLRLLRSLRFTRTALALVSVGGAILWPACTEAYVRDGETHMDVPRMVLESQTSPDVASAWLVTCLMFREEGNLKLALKACDRAVALDREDPAAFRLRGDILLKLGEAERAVIDYAELTELQKDEPSAYQLRGFALLALHKTRDAFKDFDFAIRLRPHDSTGYFVRGSAHEAIADYTPAIQDFGTAIALAPKDDEAWNARCWTRTIANRELSAALADCREAVRLAPDSAVALNSLGFVYLRLDRAHEACGAFDRALGRSPQLALSLFGRGIAELRQGDLAAGKKDFRAAKSFEPGIEKYLARFGFRQSAPQAPTVGGRVT